MLLLRLSSARRCSDNASWCAAGAGGWNRYASHICDDPRRVAKIAIVGITTDAGDDGRLAQWLRLLAHVDPIAAAGHLESMRVADLERLESRATEARDGL